MGSWESAGGSAICQEVTKDTVTRSAWKGAPEWVTAPYGKTDVSSADHPSNVRHEKSGVNFGSPLSKAKYVLLSDSEPVP